MLLLGSADLWQFSAATQWTPLTALGTAPSAGERFMVYDPVRDRMIVLQNNSSGTLFDQVSSLTLSGTPTWSPLATSGTPPAGRTGPSCVYDPLADRILVFGGAENADVLALSLAGVTPTWSVLSIAGATPLPRRYAAAAFDVVRNRMIVFGGISATQKVYGDFQSLRLSGTPSWTRIVPASGLPRARHHAVAAYDHNQDRMLIFGGEPDEYGNETLGDTWAITFRTGEQSVHLTSTGTPGARSGHSMVFDPSANKLYVFGGYTQSSSPVLLNDTHFVLFGIHADIAIVQAAKGTITRSSYNPCDVSGSTITYTANPIAGYVFSHWSGDASGTANPLSIVMSGYKTIVAHFVPATSDAFINLSWDDCAGSGSYQETFACNTDTGPSFNLFGSFRPPAGIDHFLGCSAEMTVLSYGDGLPDWWKFGSGECRGLGALSAGFDFTTGPASCADAFRGFGFGGWAYDVAYGGPNRARLRIQGAMGDANATALDPTLEYYAFRSNIKRTATTQTGYCSGCREPLYIALISIQLFQRIEDEYDPVLTTTGTSKVVLWQSMPTAVEPGAPASGGLVLMSAVWSPNARTGAVSFSLPRSGSVKLEAFDVSGRRWLRQDFEGLSAGQHEVLVNNASALASGVYFLKLTQDRDIARGRLVIQQ